jgi:hypothetical protein
MENTNTSNNEIMVVKSDIAQVDLINELKNPNSNFYCSIADDGTRKSKVAIFNAINGADESLGDHIGEVLEIVNVVAHPVSLVDEETGEEVNCLRTVLIDKKGVTYTAVSQGITSALSRIFSLIGSPDGGAWEKEPVKMKIKQVKTRNGNNKVNTIELV